MKAAHCWVTEMKNTGFRIVETLKDQLIKHKLVENVIEVSCFRDRLLSIKSVLGDSVWHVLSTYAPQFE